MQAAALQDKGIRKTLQCLEKSNPHKTCDLHLNVNLFAHVCTHVHMCPLHTIS